jgi:hypothetical protein
MIVGVGVVAVLVLIVVSSIVGARRGWQQVGVADDVAIEKARGEAYIEHQRHPHPH